MSASERLSGIARLYGNAAFERFQDSTVLIVGIGGVGSWAAESLARSGIGHLILVDPDDLCVTNTNRQVHAQEGTYGRPKTGAMTERLRAINPEIRITEYQAFLSEKNVAEILDAAPDAIVDAIDSVRAKCHLLAASHQRRIPIISSGAAGGRRDPTQIRVLDLAYSGRDTLLAAVRRKLRDQHGFPKAPMGTDAKPFGIEAIFSNEPALYPTCDGGVSHERPGDQPAGLRCDAGYGSVTHVTASFGFIAAGRVLEWLSAG
ncbi:tRNA threonylcarbamoyladenosine dehydratase [Haloferula sp.]|uniref:tRNA threonylcarbamoyladenosine dehydratase n=1 Tax=Haloferula sp. TaxID=2497595 RepID=UPI003C73E9B4